MQVFSPRKPVNLIATDWAGADQAIMYMDHIAKHGKTPMFVLAFTGWTRPKQRCASSRDHRAHVQKSVQ
jgi:hypothetical protein